MPSARALVWRALPVLLLLALYWPGLTTWFYQDDFGWLNLRHDVHSAGDLGAALFAPKAHGNMRPLGENAYWLMISSLFGPDPLPFHLAAFLTQSASLLLLYAIVRRLTASRVAACAAQILWMANIGVAPTLGWSSIYNQILSAFFFLLAFYLLLRHLETGRRAYWAVQWIAFIFGLGALEINVMYPALAAVYALLFAPPLLKKVLPMFGVSALVVCAHFYFAPPGTAGVYAPHVDARVWETLWTYWTWALGPIPPGATLLLTAAVCLMIASAIRRGMYLALLGLAWFAFPLLPYLALPNHKMEYYLAVPAIGIALLGATAISQAIDQGINQGRGLRALWTAVTAVCVLVYLGASLRASYTTTWWQHARAERVEDLVLAVQEVHQSAPRKIILLDGIDTDLFWSGVADLPFRALSIPRVYLAPGAAARIQAAPDLLSKYTLPQTLSRHAMQAGTAVVYRFDGHLLHRVAAEGLWTEWTEAEPHFINMADDVFQDYFGPGWHEAPGGYRSMTGTATVRIGGPRLPAEHLYAGIFEPRDIHLRVCANGAEIPVELAHRDNDLSEFRATLPAAAVNWKQMEVTLTADRSPLLFGYLEVR